MTRTRHCDIRTYPGAYICGEDALWRVILSKTEVYRGDIEDEVAFMCQEHFDDYLDDECISQSEIEMDGWASRLTPNGVS